VGKLDNSLDKLIRGWLGHRIFYYKQCVACDNVVYHYEHICPYCNNYRFTNHITALSGAVINYLKTKEEDLPDYL